MDLETPLRITPRTDSVRLAIDKHFAAGWSPSYMEWRKTLHAAHEFLRRWDNSALDAFEDIVLDGGFDALIGHSPWREFCIYVHMMEIPAVTTTEDEVVEDK